jgi:chemotaxis protein CheY-P-specific phosphatase CheC
MIQDVAQQLIGQFANSLKAQLGQSQTASVAASAAQPEAKPAEPPKAQAISGFSLLFMMIGAFFRRLSGSSKA